MGGLALPKQERLLGYHPEIVVGTPGLFLQETQSRLKLDDSTPGRLWELICSGHVHFRQLTKLKFLVIDEADRMVRGHRPNSIVALFLFPMQLETGHFEELSSIIDRINASDTVIVDSLFGTDEGTSDTFASDTQNYDGSIPLLLIHFDLHFPH